MAKKVIDELGREFKSIYAAAHAWGLYGVGGSSAEKLERTGQTTIHGHTFRLSDEDYIAPAFVPHTASGEISPVFEKLAARYSPKELEQLANGEGIERRRIDYPEIHLHGRHHHFVVISDTHIGSVYSPDEWHDIVADYANENCVEAVLHCGDLTDGVKISRAGTQIYELSEVGFEAQKAKAVELLGKYEVPVYIISGNHDAYYKEYAGANVVASVAKELPNVTHIGDDEADIEIDGVTIRLFHGGDGNSYALSYRLQKLVEAITGGRKPNILLAGHAHKFCYIFERNIHAISVPCLQMQTAFMRGKKLAAHTGFLDLQFDVIDGGICNLAVKLFPFYA